MYALMVTLTVVYVLACSFLCFVVLIQKGEGGGLGGAFGGGAVDVAFGAKADMTWKRATAVCAAIFMLLAMFLGVLHHRLDRRSIAEDAEKRAKLQREQQQQTSTETSTETTTSTEPQAPGVPQGQQPLTPPGETPGSAPEFPPVAPTETKQPEAPPGEPQQPEAPQAPDTTTGQ